MGIKTKVKDATTMKHANDPPAYVVKDFAAATRNLCVCASTATALPHP